MGVCRFFPANNLRYFFITCPLSKYYFHLLYKLNSFIIDAELLSFRID